MAKNVCNCKSVYTAIHRAKTILYGNKVCGNFGQDYVRQIRDKFGGYELMAGEKSIDDRNKRLDAINNFDDWCSCYRRI